MPLTYISPQVNKLPVNPTIEKLEVVTALSPILDSNIQQMHTMSVLLDIAHDYVRELRRRLDQLQ
jgi:hypothetical protein